MSTLNSPDEINLFSRSDEVARAILFGERPISREVWTHSGLELEVLEFVYGHIKQRLSYMRGKWEEAVLGDSQRYLKVVRLNLIDEGSRGGADSLEVYLGRDGGWVVATPGDMPRPFDNCRSLLTYVNLIAPVADGFRIACWDRMSGREGGTVDSIPLLLAEVLVELFERSCETKTKDLEREREVLGELQALMSHVVH